MGRIWLKLYVGWHESDWLSVLSPESRLCWILMLERVKTHGDGGSLKKSNYDDLARRWNLGVEHIRTMVKAAVIDGAIEEDETHWHVCGWSDYQEDRTNAERQKRYRDRQKESGEALQNVTNNALRQKKYRDRKKRNESGSDNGALRNDRNVTTRGEENRGDTPPTPSRGKADFDGADCPDCLRESALVWQRYRRSRKQPLVRQTWESLFTKYGPNPDGFKSAVAYTVEKGWQGLQEPTASPNGKQGSAPRRSAEEAARMVNGGY